MIEGVEVKRNTRYGDERGYFQELIRNTDDFFEGFGQWSMSYMYSGTIKAWHIHQKQTDWWFCAGGVIKAVLCDLRGDDDFTDNGIWVGSNFGVNYYADKKFDEYFLGGHTDPIVLKIPPGVAHGLKVIQGPAVLMYITSEVYNPDDEGRIAYDALGYDWLKGAEIK